MCHAELANPPSSQGLDTRAVPARPETKMVLTAQNRFLDSRFIVADRVDQDSELCCALFSLGKKIGVPKNRVPVPLGPKRKWSRPPKIGLQTRGSSWPIEWTGTRSSAARLNHKLARRPHQRASMSPSSLSHANPITPPSNC